MIRHTFTVCIPAHGLDGEYGSYKTRREAQVIANEMNNDLCHRASGKISIQESWLARVVETYEAWWKVGKWTINIEIARRT